MKERRLQDEYELRGILGRGAMGEIYRGLHMPTGREVALKVINPGQDEETRKRRERALHKEVAAIAKMDHQRIIRIFDFGVVDTEAEGLVAGSPYFAMELAQRSLSLKDVGSWSQARAVLVQILDGLAHAHARGVLHRDLKPDNILVRDSARDNVLDICLSDFGIAYAFPRARAEQESAANERSISGTPHYMAPEQAMGSWRDWGAWTDLYALGAITWELVTGHPLFTGRSVFAVVQQHLEAPLPAWEPRFSVPERLFAWVERLLRKEPLERFLRAAGAARELAALPDVEGEADKPGVDPSCPTQTLDLNHLLTRTLTMGLMDTEVFQPPVSRDRTGEDTPQARPWKNTWAQQSNPLPSWRSQTVGPRGDHFLPQLSMHGLREIPLQGRIEQRDRIWNLLQEAVDTGQPRIAVLRGNSGQGGSALGRWVGERSHELGVATTLFAYHGPGVDNDRAFAAMLAEMMGCQGLSQEELEPRVRRFLHRFGDPSHLEVDARLLADIYRPVTEGVTEVEQREQVERFMAAARMLRYLCKLGPAVMVFDEVQWGSQTLGYLRHLQITQPEGVPLLAVLTVADDLLEERKEEAFILERILAHEEATAAEVRLSPLSDGECGALLDTLAPLAPALKERLIEKAAGSPAYAYQIFSWLLEEEVLRYRGGVYDVVEGTRLPSSMHDLGLARMAPFISHDQTHECFLLVSSLFGLEIQTARSVAVVTELLGDNPGFDGEELIEGLLGRGLVVRRGGRVFFAQNNLRQALLHLVERHPWKKKITLGCEAYLRETGTGHAALRIYEERARLLESVGELDRAFQVCDEAMSQYRRTGDLHAPRLLLRRMESIKKPYQLGQAELPTKAQWSIEVNRGWLGWTIDTRDQAHQAVSRLKEIESRLGMQPSREFRTLRAFLYCVTGRQPEAIEILQELIEESEGVELFRLMERYAWSLSQLGELDEALAVSRQALVLAEENEVPDSSKGALYLRLTRLLYWLGDYEEAHHHMELAREIFRPAGSPTGLAEVANCEGDILRAQGDLEGAEIAYRAALHYAELAGEPDSLVETLNLLFIGVLLGRTKEVTRRVGLEVWEHAVRKRALAYQPYIRLLQAWAEAVADDRKQLEFFWRDALCRFEPGVEPDGVLLAEAISTEAKAKGWDDLAAEMMEWAQEVSSRR